MAKKETVKTEQDYKRMINNPDNWEEIINDFDRGERTMCFLYKGHTVYRMDTMDYAKCEWKKKCWYHITPAGIRNKIDIRQFVELLQKIDREREVR